MSLDLGMAAPVSAASARGRCRILVVEDDPMDVDLTLRAFGRHVATKYIAVARDGEEALSWLERWRSGSPLPDLILLDLKLPRVDGLEVLRRLRAHASTAKVPVVVLTSSAEERDLRDAYATGANSYIIKPVDFERFVDMAELIQRYWCHFNQAPVNPVPHRDLVVHEEPDGD